MSNQPSRALHPPRMTILSDHPILRPGEGEEQRETDSFTLHSRLGAVYDIIRHKNTRPPLAIAVYGDWGTGKSSAMRWLSDQLTDWSKLSKTERKNHYSTRTVWFDPWKYTKREDVWRGLVAEVILRAIDLDGASMHTVVEAAKQFGLFLGRSFLNILSSTKITAGAEEAGAEVDLAALSKIADDYRQTTHPEKAYLNDFESALRNWVDRLLSKDERMVIFIDDLDRCLPEVVLEVLEALKLYLNIPKLIFVVGLDREVVDAVVKHHYDKNGLGKDKAAHYLDKMFQVEVEIPPSQTQMEDYLKHQIAAMNTASEDYWSKSLTGWKRDYREIIESKIATLAEDNPREIKRLLNSTLLRGTAAARHDELGGKEAERFTQGCQVYLMQCVLRKYVPNSAGLLRDRRALMFFEDWSEFTRKYSLFRPRKEATGEKRADDSEDAAVAQRELGTVADGEYEELRGQLPRYRDVDEAYPLLDQPDLWNLLAIPFSAEVAAAAVIDKPQPWFEEFRESESQVSDSQFTEPEAQPSAYEFRPTVSLGVGATARGVRGKNPDLSTIPRAVLSAIARTLDKSVDVIQPDDFGRVETLNLSSADITDLKSLAGLTTLQRLNLYGTHVADLTPLAGLATLQSLDLSGTQATDLTPLAGLTTLQELHLPGTHVTDLTPLAGLMTLQRLNLYGTPVTDLTPLAGLTTLQTLDLTGTPVTDLGPLAGLMMLQRLDLFGTPVTDLTPLAGLTTLQTLDLTGTQVTDLAPLAGLTILQQLYLKETQVTDLTPLKHIKHLVIYGP